MKSIWRMGKFEKAVSLLQDVVLFISRDCRYKRVVFFGSDWVRGSDVIGWARRAALDGTQWRQGAVRLQHDHWHVAYEVWRQPLGRCAQELHHNAHARYENLFSEVLSVNAVTMANRYTQLCTVIWIWQHNLDVRRSKTNQTGLMVK